MRKLILLAVLAAGIGGGTIYVNAKGPGDAAEAPAVEALTVQTAQQMIVGHWQAALDENSDIVFNADGTMQDLYAGEDMGSGTWEITDTGDYILLTTLIDGMDFEYAVYIVNEEYLSMNYMPRGNTLEYRRISD